MSKTDNDRRFHGLVADYGCIACKEDGQRFSQAAVHHIQFAGGAKKHWAVIPLCPSHHQYGEVSIHRAKKTFRKKYGTEWELYLTLRDFMITKGIWPDHVETAYKDYAKNNLI